MTEVELCTAFREIAEADGWTVYPEVMGWDLLLVWDRETPVATSWEHQQALPTQGEQVAIEAKTRANITALAQCLDRTRWGRAQARRGAGPHRVAVLAPRVGKDFRRVAGTLDFGTYSLAEVQKPYGWKQRFKVLPAGTQLGYPKPLWVPPIVCDRPAGESSPSPLTHWKVQALRLCSIALERGYVTSQDFKDLKISMTAWRQGPWIERSGTIEGTRRAKYQLVESKTRPDLGWEKERDLIAEKDAKNRDLTS